MGQIRRGDIFYANLEPVVGSEQGGVRPVVVIQNNTGNQFSSTVIVAAITARKKVRMPTHVQVNGIALLKQDSVVLLEQIRTLDRKRFLKYIGRITPMTQRKIDKALAISVGIGCA